MQEAEYIKKLKTLLTVDEVVRCKTEYHNSIPTIPDRQEYPCPNIGDVIDENKTVRWNREEVERLRFVYKNQQNYLTKQRKNAVSLAEQRIKEIVAANVDIPDTLVDVVWRYAYDKKYGECGFYAVAEEFEDLAQRLAEYIKTYWSKEEIA